MSGKRISAVERQRLRQHFVLNFLRTSVTQSLIRVSQRFSKFLSDPTTYYVANIDNGFCASFFKLKRVATAYIEECVQEEGESAKNAAASLYLKRHKALRFQMSDILTEIQHILSINYADLALLLLRSWMMKAVGLTLSMLMERDYESARGVVKKDAEEKQDKEKQEHEPLYTSFSYGSALRYAVLLHDLFFPLIEQQKIGYRDIYASVIAMIEARKTFTEDFTIDQLLEFMTGRFVYVTRFLETQQEDVRCTPSALVAAVKQNSAIDCIRQKGGAAIPLAAKRYAERHVYLRVLVALTHLTSICRQKYCVDSRGPVTVKHFLARELQAIVNKLPPKEEMRAFVSRLTFFIRTEAGDYMSRIGFDLTANNDVEASIAKLNDYVTTYEIVYAIWKYGGSFDKIVLGTVQRDGDSLKKKEKEEKGQTGGEKGQERTISAAGRAAEQRNKLLGVPTTIIPLVYAPAAAVMATEVVAAAAVEEAKQ